MSIDRVSVSRTEKVIEAAGLSAAFIDLAMRTTTAMQLGRSVNSILLLTAAVVLRAGIVSAAPPKVPALPSQPAGYVQYAVDSLPPQYINGPLAANNTPEESPITNAGAALGRALFYDKRL